MRMAFWVLGALLVYSIFQGIESNRQPKATEVSYSEFITAAQAGTLKQVEIAGNELTVTPSEGVAYKLVAPRDDEMMKILRAANVKVVAKEVEGQSVFVSLLISILPIILIVGLLFLSF